MNKKLIAAAIAAALPMAANAGVTVYGIAQLELADVENNGVNGTTHLIDSKNSRLGVKWSEDLGGGLKAVGEMEFGPNFLDAAPKNNSSLTTQDSGLYARQANVGLKGAFGEVRFGTNKQPYKYAGGVKYDAFVATGAEARSGNGGMHKSHFGQGGYFANSIAYTNKFGNIKVAIATSLDESADSANKYVGRDGDLMAAVTVGLGKGAEVGVALASDDVAGGATTGAAGEDNTKIFGKYTIGAHTILAQIEQIDYVAANSDLDIMFLGYRFKMGKNTFVAQLGETDKDGGTAGDVDYMSVGAIHSFSKKTSAFIAYMDKDAAGGTAGDKTALSLGLKTKF